MPFRSHCIDHPDWVGDGTTTDAITHLRSTHQGKPINLDGGPVTFTFERQAIAQGSVLRRMFACRVCATLITTTDPHRLPYCEDHT